MRLLILLLRFLGLHLVDFNAVFLIREAGVDGEGICFLNLAAFRPFDEHTVHSTGKGLQRAFQFGVVEIGCCLDLCVWHGFAWLFAVEVEQDDGLEGADDDLLVAFGKVGFELAMG